MLETTDAEIDERLRLAAPVPQPQAIAHDGNVLWIGSWETSQVFGLDPRDGREIERVSAPGKPVGATVLGDELRFVLSETDDSRFIRRFIPGHGFKTHEPLACPDDTGSMLAYDGTNLWLSQRHNGRLLALDGAGRIRRTIELGEQITGFTCVAERFYVVLWLGKRGGSKIASIAYGDETPELRIEASSPFVTIGLAHDGTKFWTNDFRADQSVAFVLPERT